MQPRHVSLLKAMEGEFLSLENLDQGTADKFLPMFEIGRLTDTIRERKYMRLSATPIMTYLDRKLAEVGKVWSNRPAMIDGYQWPADMHVENGEHVIAYMVSRLRSLNVSVIPVIGYDRWGQLEYRQGLQNIPARQDGHYCLRLDNSAIEDAAEPELFEETILEIVESLELDPASCSVLIDFADISMDAMSIDTIITKASNLIRQLELLNFRYYVVAGCSMPKTINLAVSDQDSTGIVLRKEILVWQALRLEFPELNIVSGDYGVRGPTTTEIRSKYTNGKIRHTIKNRTFVVRGHPFTNDHNYEQMHDLSEDLISSSHFLGSNFSWGDSQISECRRRKVLGNLSRWIAIDTNHHLTFVVQEVEEFERDVVAKAAGKAKASA